MHHTDTQDLWHDEIVARQPAPAVKVSAGAACERRLLPYLRERIKLEARALLHRRHTHAWLRLLNSHPAFADLARSSPRLLHKIYRPYLTAGLDVAQRVAVLEGHYRFLFGQGLAPLVTQAARAPVELAALDGRAGSRYTIVLRSVAPMEREGELVLQLCTGGAVVYSAACTFSLPQGAPVLHVGCIQGPRGGDGLALNRQATRDLHGLRPKQLLLTLLRQLGFDFGCAQLRLVGNANRVVRGALRQGRVHADYDAFWREQGAERRADGDWQLACMPLCPPDLARVASNKRAEARRRHALCAAALESARLRLALPARALRAAA